MKDKVASAPSDNLTGLAAAAAVASGLRLDDIPADVLAQSRRMGTTQHLSALWTGAAGHAMGRDDTQLAEGKGRSYGLPMPPAMPPPTAALTLSDLVAQETGAPVDGKRFVTAFCAGFQVGCKIAEAINPDHCMHCVRTSGIIRHFAAVAAAAAMLGLDPATTARALGIAASVAAGVRANCGSMGKPCPSGVLTHPAWTRCRS